MMEPQAAETLISEHLVCLPIESLPVGQCAGAVLRENVYAERDQPPFDRVAMDGIALVSSVAASGRRRFKVQATQAAGEAPYVLASDENCIEVMTGAVLPGGCDTVIPVEQLRSTEGYADIDDGVGRVPWKNVHRRASDRTQGALLLAAGSVLNAPEIAVAASAGMARVRVSSQPAIVVVSTGNELVEPGDPIEPHQIRRSNAYAVVAALRQRGFQRVADDHLPDDAQTLRERLRLHLQTHEVLILSGGVSMGRFDLVPKALEDIGVRCVLHGIAQRPGRPMWYGAWCATWYRHCTPQWGCRWPRANASRSRRRSNGKRRWPDSCPYVYRMTTGHGRGQLPARPTVPGISPPWRRPTDLSSCRPARPSSPKVMWHACFAGENCPCDRTVMGRGARSGSLGA
jgi:molybdopterin molybdotransferase